jgi:plasmid stabilization system protein ParE
MEVIWTQRASDNLDYFTAKLVERSGLPEVGINFYNKVLTRTDKLVRHPTWIGVEVKEYPGCGYRSLYVMDYRIIYRVDHDAVYIVAFVHKRMLIDGFL